MHRKVKALNRGKKKVITTIVDFIILSEMADELRQDGMHGVHAHVANLYKSMPPQEKQVIDVFLERLDAVRKAVKTQKSNQA